MCFRTWALQQSTSRYVSGLTNYQAVLTALTTQQQAELNVIDARSDLVVTKIALLDAAGGRWMENLGEFNEGNKGDSE